MADEQKYRLTDHAREEAERRRIPLDVIKAIMENPGQVVEAHSDRKVYQSKVEIEGKLYVVRVVVEETDPLTVITVYRTSNIKKYWSDES